MNGDKVGNARGQDMNTVICTHRDNLNGKLKRTTIVYLDPPATWSDYGDAIGAGLAT